MIGQTISHYRIVEKLGEGGMGIVYKAHDFKLDRFVALKFLPHDQTAEHDERARFLQEAKAASALNQPNVCVVHDIAEHEDKQFIVMEYIDGVTLRKKFAQALLKINESLDYAIQIGEALQEAHSKGIIHRDIKADNIMINSKNQVKVMDFGLAKLRGVTRITKAQSTLGTLGYMSPEQIQGKDVDGRSDIFSFGVVLYEMLTGHMPFRGEHEAAMMYSIINEEPIPLEKFRQDVSSELSRIILRALEKDPEDRYQNAKDMIIDLRRLKKETTRVVRPVEMPTDHINKVLSGNSYARSSPLMSKKNVLIGIGILALMGVLTVWYFFVQLRAVELNPNMTFRNLAVPFKEFGYPGFSQDGSWIAFSAPDVGGKYDVYLMNSSSLECRRITNDSTTFPRAADVNISPDGSQIVIERSSFIPKVGLAQEMFIASLLGGATRKIVDEGASARWRPDGGRIGYIVTRRDGKAIDPELWSIKPEGTEKKLEYKDTVSIKGGGYICFAWSPDGKSIAWLRTIDEKYQEIIIHELQSGREKQITSEKKPINEICWAHNDQIIYSTTTSGNWNLWTVPATGGQPLQITKGTETAETMKISADGKKLLYLQRENFSQIWIANGDGSGAHPLTSDEHLYDQTNISPDKSTIVYRMVSSDPLKSSSNIFLMNKDGTNRRQLTYGEDFKFRPRWSPNGKLISYATFQKDTARTFVIDLANPNQPKYVCLGVSQWIDSENLFIWDKSKSYWHSLIDGTMRQMCKDSMFVRPFPGKKFIYGWENSGSWISIVPEKQSLDEILFLGKEIGTKKHLPADGFFSFSTGGDYLFELKKNDEMWRLSLPDFKETRIGKLPMLRYDGQNGFSVSDDGSEIAYVIIQTNSKFVMIENVFK